MGAKKFQLRVRLLDEPGDGFVLRSLGDGQRPAPEAGKDRAARPPYRVTPPPDPAPATVQPKHGAVSQLPRTAGPGDWGRQR